jgi:hypothetical protein
MTEITLRDATRVRRQLLRQGVRDARKQAAETGGILAALMADGSPENGLSEALRAAHDQASKLEEALGRIEAHQFHGDKEGG